MQPRLAVVAVLALAGCLAPRTFRNEGTPHFAPTDPERIVVVDAIPDSALVLGSVDGIGTNGGFIIGIDALENAKKGAAQLGADGLVIVSRGTEPAPGDLFGRSYAVAKVTALRLSR